MNLFALKFHNFCGSRLNQTETGSRFADCHFGLQGCFLFKYRGQNYTLVKHFGHTLILETLCPLKSYCKYDIHIFCRNVPLFPVSFALFESVVKTVAVIVAVALVECQFNFSSGQADCHAVRLPALTKSARLAGLQ